MLEATPKVCSAIMGSSTFFIYCCCIDCCLHHVFQSLKYSLGQPWWHRYQTNLEFFGNVGKLWGRLEACYLGNFTFIKYKTTTTFFTEIVVFSCGTSRYSFNRFRTGFGSFCCTKKAPFSKSAFCIYHFVVPPGIEPGTHGFSVRCSTNWAKVPDFSKSQPFAGLPADATP